MMTPEVLFSMRNVAPLPLPRTVADVIASLHRVQVPQGFVKKPRVHRLQRKSHADMIADWRVAALSDVRRRVKEKDDPEYAEVFSILNKLSKQTYDKLSDQVLALLQKRVADPMFRLRVVTLVFSKSIDQQAWHELYANLLKKIADAHPPEADGGESVICDDLRVSCNLDSFSKLYAEEAIVLPPADDDGFDEAVIRWTKQKARRRGFMLIMTDLYKMELVDETLMKDALDVLLSDIQEAVACPKTSATEEYIAQLVSTLTDMASSLKGNPILAPVRILVLRMLTTNLPMRIKFKLEDAKKLL
jgi:hypothetical protein